MHKAHIKLFSILVAAVYLFLLSSNDVLAVACSPSQGFGESISRYQPGAKHTLIAELNNLNATDTYFLSLVCESCIVNKYIDIPNFKSTDSKAGNKGGAYTLTPLGNGSMRFEWEITAKSAFDGSMTDSASGVTRYDLVLYKFNTIRHERVCDPIGSYELLHRELFCGQDARVVVSQKIPGRNEGLACYYPGCLERGSDFEISYSGLKARNSDGVITSYSGPVTLVIGQVGGGVAQDQGDFNASAGSAKFTYRANEKGTYTIKPKVSFTQYDFFKGCEAVITIRDTCGDSCQAEELSLHPSDLSTGTTTFKLCDQIADGELRTECERCAGTSNSETGGAAGVWTAVGCIQREPTALISALIQIGLGAAGGVALLTVLAAGFMLTTSQGNPKRADEAKEMITAAVIGLLFIIFSVTILQFIGYNILKIPGFGG